MHLRAFILLAVSSLTIPLAFSQTVDFNDGRIPMTDLAGPWRFHTGDQPAPSNPAWSSPAFDDSQWPLLYAGKSWSRQGYHNYAGVAWYRLSVTLPDHPGPLALYLPSVDISCQVFANGRLIGQIGKLPPQPRYDLQFRSLFPIPSDVLVPNQPLQLAVRVWLQPSYAGIGAGGLSTLPRIGDAVALEQWRQLQIHDAFWRRAAGSSDVWINILTALAGIGLFLMRRREREYLWWGVSQAFWAAFDGISLAAAFFTLPFAATMIANITTMLIASYLQYLFYVLFLRQRRGVLFWLATLSILLIALIQIAFIFEPVPLAFLQPVSEFVQVFGQICVVGILWIGARRGDRDVPYLLIPNCIMLAARVLQSFATLPAFFNQSWAAWMRHLLGQPITWPYNVPAFQILGDFEMLAVLVILVRRYARSRQDEERLESELEAARAVQKVLIPTEVPAIPGFSVETVYQPAAQVGGDFFQIIPLPAGGALIAIGDVSGKGMPAAMTVSLLVGTLRTLAYYTQSPAEILTAMNRRMLARSQGGFTTCLILRLNPDASLLLANAGHIAPYLGGREIEIENGLPLGLAESAKYSESTIRLRNHDQLTLLTDGVVEARSPNGELLGFERTAAISAGAAEDIARVASTFGQQDDITVLTLSMSSAPVPA